jgi:hypothetical protein
VTVSENCVAVSEFHGCDCGKSTRSNERKYLQRKAHIYNRNASFSEFTR